MPDPNPRVDGAAAPPWPVILTDAEHALDAARLELDDTIAAVQTLFGLPLARALEDVIVGLHEAGLDLLAHGRRLHRELDDVREARRQLIAERDALTARPAPPLRYACGGLISTPDVRACDDDSPGCAMVCRHGHVPGGVRHTGSDEVLPAHLASGDRIGEPEMPQPVHTHEPF